MFRKVLKGIRVGVLAADGFEQVELTLPMKALRKRGAQVDIISLHKGRIRGMNLMYPGKKVRVDDTVDHVRPRDFDALLIPGGFVNPDALRQNQDALAFVREFHWLARPIATLCHGPWVLVSAGLVRGRKLAAWPGIKDDIRNAGGQWMDEPGVRDELWFTSRGPHDMRHFLNGMVSLFAEKAPRNHARKGFRWGRWLFAAMLGLVAIRPVRTALAR
jgi:protease I